MRLLVDHEIRATLESNQPLVTGLPQPLDSGMLRSSQVQAASLSLTIGDIFIPRTRPNRLGGANTPRRKYVLNPGHTAVIRTREAIYLNPRQAGIGFPHAFESLSGLLMTNPGHIDPGYSGPLHCTVINMGHAPFTLNYGDRIMRVLIFELDKEHAPAAPYNLRHGLQTREIASSPINAELLDRLPKDFVDVEERAGRIADSAITRAQVRAGWLPFLVAIISGFLGFAATYLATVAKVKEDLTSLRTDFVEAKTRLENKDALHRLEDEVTSLKNQIDLIKNRGRESPKPTPGRTGP